MQDDNNLLDQYLKSKVEEADFAFKEEYWLKAAKMLDEADNQKKRPAFWRWFSLLGVLITVSVGAFFYSHKPEKNKQIGQTNTTQAQTQESSQASASQTPSYIQDAPMTAEENIKTITPSTQNQENISKQTQSSNQLTQSTKDNATTPSTNPLTPSQETKETKVPGESNKMQQVIDETKEKNQVKQTKRNDRKQERKRKQMLNQQIANEKSLVGKNNELQPKPISPNPSVQIHGKQMQAIDTQIFVQSKPRDESIYNPRYNALLKNYETERLDSITVLTFNPIPNVTPAVTNVPKDTNVLKNKSWKMFLSGGAHFNKGFKGNQQTSVAWGIAPWLHAGVEKKLNARISIAAQIGFTYFNALNVQKKVIHYKYSFGYDSTQLTVDYQRMYQMTLPISISYQLHKSHTLWTALGTSYVLNTSSKVVDNGKPSTQTGYKDGINPFDIFTQLGYQYRLNKQFSLLAMWQQGLTNATQQQYFNISTHNKQTRLSIGLKYYFKRNGE